MRSRTGSRGKVVTSTMTLSSSRMSATPPWAPDGALSAALVSSTRSPTCSSAIAAISPIVGLGVGRNQPWCRVHIRVVPCRYGKSDSFADSKLAKDFTAHSGAGMAKRCHWCGQHTQSDRFPNEIEVVDRHAEDAIPLRSMAVLREDPVGPLLLRAPGILGTRQWIANSWWPVHLDHAMERRRTCVRLRSILRVEIHTEGGQR